MMLVELRHLACEYLSWNTRGPVIPQHKRIYYTKSIISLLLLCMGIWFHNLMAVTSRILQIILYFFQKAPDPKVTKNP